MYMQILYKGFVEIGRSQREREEGGGNRDEGEGSREEGGGRR